MATADECKLCGNDYAWHRDNIETLQHRFVPRDGSLAKLNDNREKKPTAPVQPQGDPVLRIALLKAGIITPDQLQDAENDLKSGKPVVIYVDRPDLPVGMGSIP